MLWYPVIAAIFLSALEITCLVDELLDNTLNVKCVSRKKTRLDSKIYGLVRSKDLHKETSEASK